VPFSYQLLPEQPLDDLLRVVATYSSDGLDPLADALRQLDDDSLRAPEVAEPLDVLVALELADELSAEGSRAGNDGVDVLDGEGNMADTRHVRRRRPAGRCGSTASGTSPARVFRCRPEFASD
jgi:hypothetical protein